MRAAGQAVHAGVDPSREPEVVNRDGEGSAMALPQPIDFPRWIEENRHLLKPPVGNRTLVVGDDYIVQVVGGPNARTDYHVDPYEEWFYQLEGNMHVDVIDDDGSPRRIDIREGETWLLPRGVPHSPQRPEAGSIGLVVERIREEGLLEKFQWYCLRCAALVHETELQVRDIVKDLPPVFDAFYADEQARTCPKCATVHPGKAAPPAAAVSTAAAAPAAAPATPAAAERPDEG